MIETAQKYPFADSPPVEVLRPSSESEATNVIRRASAESLALVPMGGRTSVHTGNRLRANSWALLSTERLAGEIEFSSADMVVTVTAGTTLAVLQENVNSAGQFLPIDHPAPETATMGGIVASNAQGLWRSAYGLPRDRLLGVRVVLADGSAVKGGGKVVKNVAGYDLNKLFAGSWGTLGFITEATFKTNPQPESTYQLNFLAESIDSAAEAALAIYDSRLDPAYAVVTNHKGTILSVGMMGSSGTVDWQNDAIRRLLVSKGLESTDSAPTENELRAMIGAPDRLCARFSVLPTDLSGILRAINSRKGIRIRSQIAVGIIDLEIPEADEEHISFIQGLRPSSGHMVWTSVPKSASPIITDVWGPARPEIHLMRGIKKALDPDNIFSPGRFIAGI